MLRKLRQVFSQHKAQLPGPLVALLRLGWINFQGLSLFVLTSAGYVPSHYFRRFVYRFVYHIRLGRGSIIHWQVRFFEPGGVSIGDYCNIGNNAFLDGRCGLTIGNRVATGAEVMIYTLQHDVQSTDFRTAGGPVVIRDYVYLGPRVIVLPGVTIGEGAVVAAGAIVTHDVAPYTVVAGVPARFIAQRVRQ